MPVAQRFRPLRSATAKQAVKTIAAPSIVSKGTATATTTMAANSTTTDTIQETSLSSDIARMTSTQSRLIVKTMLDATFGCITFLRGLLPEDNFEDYQFAPSQAVDTASQSRSETPNIGGGSQSLGQSGGDARGKGLRIKKIKKGYSPEADKLLDWLDVGVMDAVDKRHLKSLVFAIYLDPDDPSNLIETVTFNFFYHRLADDSGRNHVVPTVSIHDGIGGLTLGEGGGEAPKLKTVGEVKKALRKVIKSLIVTCQSLNDLPSKRWVTMKLLYMDGTPQEYEPPLFKPVDKATPEWHLCTHRPDEVPWKTNVGVVDDGFHAMSVKIMSVADIIPPPDSEKEKDGTPWGSTALQASSTISKRHREEEEQREDAGKRRYLWHAMDVTEERADIDPAYKDAEGEPDSQSDDIPLPNAVRQKDGTTIAFKQSSAPTYLMGAKDDRDVVAMRGAGGDLLRDLAQHKLQPLSTHTAAATQTYVSKDGIGESEADPTATNIPQRDESISSFSVPPIPPVTISQFHDGVSTRSRRGPTAAATRTTPRPPKDVVKCPCGFDYDDRRPMVSCDMCSNWVHLCCMGHETAATLPVDQTFVCLSCVIKSSGKGKRQAAALAMLPTLALLRRSLDIMRERREVSERWSLFVHLGVEKLSKRKARNVMMQDCTEIMIRMEKEGFIEAKQRSVGSDYGKKKPWVWKAGNEEPLRQYFCTGGTVDNDMLGLTLENYPYVVNPKHTEIATPSNHVVMDATTVGDVAMEEGTAVDFANEPTRPITAGGQTDVATEGKLTDKESIARDPVDMGI